MLTVFGYSVSRSRGLIIGWGLSLFLLGFLLVPFYDTIVEQADQFTALLEAYPPELLAFFGDFTSLATPEGYLGVEFFSYMPLVLGIFAISAGSGLLSSDEESGFLDLILAHPISRTKLFLGRLLAFIFVTFSILAITYLGILIPAQASEEFNVGWRELTLPFLSLFALLMLYGGLAILLSLVLPSRKSTAMVSGIVLVASFFITGLAKIDDSLEVAARLSPLSYFQGAEAMRGLDLDWFLGLLGCTALFTLIAWWRFARRDVRVSGEGGLPFRLGPLFTKLRRRNSTD